MPKSAAQTRMVRIFDAPGGHTLAGAYYTRLSGQLGGKQRVQKLGV